MRTTIDKLQDQLASERALRDEGGTGGQSTQQSSPKSTPDLGPQPSKLDAMMDRLTAMEEAGKKADKAGGSGPVEEKAGFIFVHFLRGF